MTRINAPAFLAAGLATMILISYDAAGSGNATIWIAPNPSNAVRLCRRPWPEETGKEIYGIKLYIGWLRSQPEEALRRMADLARERRLKVAVEVGGLLNHDWEDLIAEKSAEIELAPLLRWRRAGGNLNLLDIDGPFRRAMGYHAWGKDPAKRFTDYRVMARELNEYIGIVSKEFPETRIHLLVNFPNWGWRGGPEYQGRGKDMQYHGDYHAALTAVLPVTQATEPRLAGLTIDAPYGYASAGVRSANLPDPAAIDWVGRIAELCSVARSNSLECALILNSERGRTSDQAFADDTLAYARLIKARGLEFDHLIIQSWYEYPTNVVGNSLPAQMAVAAEAARILRATK